MKKGILEIAVLMITLVFVTLIIAGCQEPKTVGSREAQAIAAENIELKKQIAARDNEIENLKQRLENREVDKEAVREAVKKQIGRMNDQIRQMLSSIAKQQEENKALKKQIEELKAGVKPK